MGFDISAYDKKKEIAYHRAYMGGFRMMGEQGYDWFSLINANECDGGVSGTGKAKFIKLKDLINARKKLKNFKVKKLSSEGRDEIGNRRERLCEFMDKCISFCREYKKNKIEIFFG